MLNNLKNKFIKTTAAKYVEAVEAGVIVNNVLCDNEEKINKLRKNCTLILTALMMVMTLGSTGILYCEPDAAATVIQEMINIICKVFRYVGVVLAVYSVGQLVMAFKNEDADSKSRATTMLVVACVLIGIKSFVDNLNLTQYLSE